MFLQWPYKWGCLLLLNCIYSIKNLNKHTLSFFFFFSYSRTWLQRLLEGRTVSDLKCIELRGCTTAYWSQGIEACDTHTAADVTVPRGQGQMIPTPQVLQTTSKGTDPVWWQWTRFYCSDNTYSQYIYDKHLKPPPIVLNLLPRLPVRKQEKLLHICQNGPQITDHLAPLAGFLPYTADCSGCQRRIKSEKSRVSFNFITVPLQYQNVLQAWRTVGKIF